jgi:hypothetical protein
LGFISFTPTYEMKNKRRARITRRPSSCDGYDRRAVRALRQPENVEMK